MRDVFTDLFAPERPDPVEAVRRATRQALPRRFYQTADVDEGEGGYRVLLDRRPVRTPARRALVAPVRPLAEALAAEWQAQPDIIDPATMPLTRLANAILDGVAGEPALVTADLLFYRAEARDELARLQAEHWDPILWWAHEALGARFILSVGIVYAAQPAAALAKAGAAIPGDPWRLGAAHVVTTLTGSALIALALLAGELTVEQAWRAAHVDEDWNIAQWGRDEAALERRAYREGEMRAAATVLGVLRDRRISPAAPGLQS